MQDEEIVAMHVHRMSREARRIVDYECDWAVRAIVVYVPVSRVGKIALVGKKEDWCIIIAAESIRPLAMRIEINGQSDLRLAIERPDKDIGSIWCKIDV